MNELLDKLSERAKNVMAIEAVRAVLADEDAEVTMATCPRGVVIVVQRHDVPKDEALAAAEWFMGETFSILTDVLALPDMPRVLKERVSNVHRAMTSVRREWRLAAE